MHYDMPESMRRQPAHDPQRNRLGMCSPDE